MGFGRDFVEDSIVSETGNWNVAQSYSEGIIMTQIRYVLYLQTIAEVGGHEPDESVTDYTRYEALKKLVVALKQMCSNTMFALKKKNDKEKFKEYYDWLKKVKTQLPRVYEIKSSQVNHKKVFVLKEETFNNFLDKLDIVKMEIYNIVNNSDLIYPTKEEFDPKAYKNAIIERATTQG